MLIQDQKYALTVLTDINNSTEQTVAKTIKAREQDFVEKRYKPIWFIERSQLTIDTDNKSLVFWASELAALQDQNEDIAWTRLLQDLAPSNELVNIMNWDKTHLDSKEYNLRNTRK